MRSLLEVLVFGAERRGVSLCESNEASGPALPGYFTLPESAAPVESVVTGQDFEDAESCKQAR